MIIIGIDPDVKKSGVVTFDGDKYEPYRLSFFDLYDFLFSKIEIIQMIYIEAGWLNKKSNWHGSDFDSKSKGESIAKSVGRNHQTGMHIVEMCQYLTLDCELIIPSSSKLKNYEMFRQMTGIITRDQEIIDAAMLIVGRKIESPTAKAGV